MVRSWLVVTLAALAASACGTETHIPSPPTATPFALAHPLVSQRGDTSATVDPASVVVVSTNDHRVQISVTLEATATKVSVIQATMANDAGTPVGIAISGGVALSAGHQASVTLSGPRPTGTIASISFELVPAVINSPGKAPAWWH